MAPLVSILITTHNSARWLEPCLHSLLELRYKPLEIIIVDNASLDATRDILHRFRGRFHIVLNDANTGFAAGQNQAMRLARGEWLLSLNPDVVVSPDFVTELVAAGERDPRVGTICGKLLRLQTPDRSGPPVIDSTGLYFARNLRHFDRGSEEPDHGQYDQLEYVFGATGAAALYRRAMVEDVSVAGEFFDEEFFAYREDADLAWRAQLMGWKCLYTPSAVSWHVRRVTPERRAELPHIINWHSIKNRFLMRAKNVSSGLYLRLAIPVTWRDMLIVGHCLLCDRKLISALTYIGRNTEQWRRKRAMVQARRRVPDRELAHWFSGRPQRLVNKTAVPKEAEVWRAA